MDRLAEVAASIGDAARFASLDVTDPEPPVAAFCSEAEECRLLVNNAGGGSPSSRSSKQTKTRWTQMYESNVLGTLRMTNRRGCRSY